MSWEYGIAKKATSIDIARLARVGTATVDRVLHNRKHVSSRTRQRVLQAKRALENGMVLDADKRVWRLKVFLPANAGPSTDFLASCFQNIGGFGEVIVECDYTEKLNPASLARKLKACVGQGVDAVAFQALDDVKVRNALEYLRERRIPGLTLVSGMKDSSVVGFVGVNNQMAGRTAGFFMKRLIRTQGEIVVLKGSQLYTAHEERETGFRSSLASDDCSPAKVSTFSGFDDIRGNYLEIKRIVHQTPDLVGIYNVGGGNEGIVRALDEMGVADKIIFLGHNLTPKTHTYLQNGEMDIVIHQDMRRIAWQAVKSLVAHLENRKVRRPGVIPVEVITPENLTGSYFC